jgi:hypothetical protein
LPRQTCWSRTWLCWPRNLTIIILELGGESIMLGSWKSSEQAQHWSAALLFQGRLSCSLRAGRE